MFPCAVCREAYFITTDARDRHQHICLALSNFYTPPVNIVSSSSSVNSSRPPNPVSSHQQQQRRPTGGTLTTDTSREEPPVTKKRHPDGENSTRKRKATPESPPSPLHEKLRRLHVSSRTAVPSTTSKVPSSADPPQRPETTQPAEASPSTSSAANADRQTTEGQDSETPGLECVLKKAFNNARDYVITTSNDSLLYNDLELFLESALQKTKEILERELEITNSLKYNIVLEATYHHPEEGLDDTRNFKTRSRMLFTETDNLDEQLRSDGIKLLKEEEEADAERSGWIFLNVKSLTLRVSKFHYKQPKGSSYLPIPTKLAKRKACINEKNQDDRCFVYAMLTKYIPNVHCNSELTEESFDDILLNKYNFNHLSFPVTVNQIKIFEKHNPATSVNVFEYKENKIAPVRIVDEKLDHVDLLLLHSDHGTSHYVFIQDFNKLIQKQITKSTHKIVVCKRCSHSNEVRKCKPDQHTWLKNHLKLCGKHLPTEIKLPSPDNNTIQFTQYEAQIKVPFVICADFESTLKPTQHDDDEDTDGRNVYQKHTANSFATIVNSTYDTEILDRYEISSEPYLYRGPDAGAKFLLHIKEIAEKIDRLLMQNNPISMTEQDKIRHEEATVCELCKRPFNDLNPDTKKCQDHDHVTSKFRYSLCSRCNLRAKTINFVPVWLHNMSSYDQAFIITNLNVLRGHEIRVIPSNTQRMICILCKINNIWIRFCDSYRMMSASLDELVKNLPNDQFFESSKLVPPEHRNLITRKGLYPYDYITCESKFKETSLPPKSAFHNQLTQTEISQEDYEHAVNVWNSLDCQNLGEYHDFYLKLDVCLLADVLNSFRTICFQHYALDINHFWTAPSLSWQAMMRYTGITLELIHDYDQYLMIESSIRGGIVQSSLRYAKSNNPFLECPSDYNPEDDTSYLLYLDAVNLYGFSLSMPLPTGNFTWVEHPDTIDWTNLPLDSPFGYYIECDVEVPKEVHDKVNDLPPLPEKAIPPNGKVEKLLATLNKKERYVAHYRLLQQAQQLGLRITKIHRILKFSQSPWMKKYIEFNSKLRSEATSDFARNFFKLLNNAVFGKSLQNNRKHMDARVVVSGADFEKYARQSRFVDRVIIKEGDNGVVIVFLRKSPVLLNKPIYIGSVTLDQSKYHMYDFYYNILKSVFKPPQCRVHLVYLDTDGMVLLIITEENLYVILKTIAKEHLDLSNYPEGHELRDDTNKQVAGKFKDETKGRALFEHIGLKSKMYCQRFSSIPVNNDTRKNETKKAKGIKTSFVDKEMRFEHYRDALFNQKEYKAKFNLIQCKKFKLTSVNVNKKSLTFDDDKRFIMDDRVHTLAHGHYKIQEIEHRRKHLDTVEEEEED